MSRVLKDSKMMILTTLVKVITMILSFVIVAFSTRLWGAEGKGYIALFTTDLGLIAIFCNVFSSSSVSYYISRVCVSKLATQAYLWVSGVSGVLAVILSLLGDFTLTLPLFMASVLLGFITFQSSLFVGGQKIKYYNLIALLQPLLLLMFMLGIYYVNKDFGYYSYFYGQIISLTIVFFIARRLSIKVYGKAKFDLDKTAVKQSFMFGWQTELSNLLQFLNYRLSYYFLKLFVDINSVGVFSIGVAISEAIWVFSKSISLVQYSNVLKQGNTKAAKKDTVTASIYSLFASVLCIVFVFLLPESVYVFIFGSEEFASVKYILLLLSPGILAIAVTNVYGNYFSAIGKLKILIIKSAVGVVFTVILSVILIPRLQITGACIVNAVSYIVSSTILVIAFCRHKAIS
ncbi:MAG: polysaccharide biosynthesis C-terminal domain-containing protein [Bacteroidales bacterium]|nr:polysaccharide biosynthesis C-terminal domain-containing protein [Bacteroidales bacterium]MDD2205536.1 polysaccharide biosynthesis C-terminal domain-containing protein [Bacteroidales bacterium]MDD3151721.1 polysaccharide biosynthesis C-terminal domain-containing protein [Bacteroidales bacterium]